MDAPAIDVEACRARQQRLLAILHQRDLELAVISRRENVQWLTGHYFRPLFEPIAALTADGQLAVVVPERHPPEVVADVVLTYEAAWHSTLRNDQQQASSQVLGEWIADQGIATSAVGLEYSVAGRHLQWEGISADIEPDLYRLRRFKHQDELARMKRAIAATERMYERAREIIKPGVTELEVFNALQAAAVIELGEMLTGTGNDYQVASRGGPPRNGKQAAAGDLYILDLGPAFQGYFADNCRTIAVTEANQVQQEAWRHVTDVFNLIQSEVRPGKSARELFQQAQARLDQAPVGEFNHHLGHGIGLFPHEAPHLNPNWDDRFEEGDVFTVEPGLYAPELQAGMRIENNYRVTVDGVELLTHFTTEL